MNRVSKTIGKSPIIVVAPHGNQEDDVNTDLIADIIATKLDAWSVINTGWRRAKKANLGENIANLNDINHCKLGPIRKEFLDSILLFKSLILKRFEQCHIFYIHGMGNIIRRKTGEAVDIVVGYGEGEPASYTCSLDYKNKMIENLVSERLVTYQGKAGGKYSAYKKNNLTQLFRQHFLNTKVQSTQLEIVNLRRYDVSIAVDTGLVIAKGLNKFLNCEMTYKGVEIKEY